MHAPALRAVLFDWGNTLMRDFPRFIGPMSEWPKVETLPHALEALTELRSRGWLTALATNAFDSGEPAIREALRRGGIGDVLDRIYSSRDVGHEKPERAFFEFILRDVGLDASAVVMVGDSFKRDVLGANAAGIRAVWFNPHDGEAHEGDTFATIHSLAEVPELLERWR